MTPLLIESYASKLTLKLSRPVGADEAVAEIHRVIHGVCDILKSQAFGYHEPEDVYQIAYYEALVVLDADRYDPAKPLENFLYTHIKNRISNLKRAQFFRYEAPCKCCDAFNPGDHPCGRWRNWFKTNSTKQQLMRPMPLSDDDVRADHDDPHDHAVWAELDLYILDRLDPELAPDYELFKDERTLPKCRRTRLRLALKEIVTGSPFAAEEP